jgi:hypothetical protein
VNVVERRDARGRSLVDDLELYAAALAHAACSHDRAQCARDSPLPADHFAEIVLSDVKPKHDCVLLVDTLDAHGVRIVDELSRQILEQL